MKYRVVLIGAIAALVSFASTAVTAADADKIDTKEKLKRDVKAAGKGVKDAAAEVGHQIATGTKKAYKNTKTKIKKDVNDGKPGDGSIAKKNEASPTATEGHK